VVMEADMEEDSEVDMEDGDGDPAVDMEALEEVTEEESEVDMEDIMVKKPILTIPSKESDCNNNQISLCIFCYQSPSS